MPVGSNSKCEACKATGLMLETRTRRWGGTYTGHMRFELSPSQFEITGEENELIYHDIAIPGPHSKRVRSLTGKSVK